MGAFIATGPTSLGAVVRVRKFLSTKDAKEKSLLAKLGYLRRLEKSALLAPIPCPKKNVICLGINYKEHVKEGARARGQAVEIPADPVFFTKPPTSVIGTWER